MNAERVITHTAHAHVLHETRTVRVVYNMIIYAYVTVFSYVGGNNRRSHKKKDASNPVMLLVENKRVF